MRLQRRAIALLSLFVLLSTIVFGLQAAPAETSAAQQNEPTQPTANITIDGGAAGTAVNPLLLGTNLPAWLGNWRTEDSTFINRTIAAGVTMVRAPGGSWSNYYDWSNCEQYDACPWDWGVLTPTDFINFSQATGAELMYTVNQNGTAKEAAALVAFFNGSVNDSTVIGVDVLGRNWGTVGQWAQLRADHGNAAPHPITYWEIGNETYGGYSGTDCLSWGWEDVWTCDGREYVNGIGSGANRHEGYLEFRNEMRRIDPSIKVGAVGVAPQDSWSNWGNEVIDESGDVMDFYVIHQYAFWTPPGSYQDALAQPQSGWDWIREDYDASLGQYANGRNIPVAFTEHNLFSVQENDNGQWMTQAVNMLFMADTLGQMTTYEFDIANQWDLANGRPANGTDYGLLDAETYERSPQYYVFPLWSRFGETLLPVTSSYNASTTLSVYAGRVDASTISVLAINKTGSAINSTIEVNGTSQISSGLADVVRANDLSSQSVTFNGVSNPNDSLSNAPSTPLSNLSNPLSYSFAPYSVTLLRLGVDDDTAVLAMAPGPSVMEGNTGTVPAVFNVSLSTPAAFQVTVDYASAAGGASQATPGLDYTPVSGTLTFTPGQTSKTITVMVMGDTNFEGVENFNVVLSNANPVTIATSTGTGRILNDDEASDFLFLPAVMRN